MSGEMNLEHCTSSPGTTFDMDVARDTACLPSLNTCKRGEEQMPRGAVGPTRGGLRSSGAYSGSD